MTDIVIVAAARTAVGKFGGALARTPAAKRGIARLCIGGGMGVALTVER